MGLKGKGVKEAYDWPDIHDMVEEGMWNELGETYTSLQCTDDQTI